MARNATTTTDDTQNKSGRQPSAPRSAAAQKSDPANAQAISPERAVAFQTWGSSGSPDAYPSAASGEAAQRAEKAETGVRDRERPIGKQQPDDEPNSAE